MYRGKLCHNRHVVFLLTGHVRSAKRQRNVRDATYRLCTQVWGFGDFRDGYGVNDMAVGSNHIGNDEHE